MKERERDTHTPCAVGGLIDAYADDTVAVGLVSSIMGRIIKVRVPTAMTAKPTLSSFVMAALLPTCSRVGVRTKLSIKITGICGFFDDTH